MSGHDAMSPELRYLRSIRNPAKRAYGFDYLNWMDRTAIHEDEPEPKSPTLSAMARQAVRMRLHAIRNAEGRS